MFRILILGVAITFFAVTSIKAQDNPLDKVKLARDRQQSSNNLKQIALAFHLYADKYKGEFPRDITDKDGKPLLSWRVAILPYLEQGELHKKFKLDEPWDSENNKKLLEKMPVTYKAPGGKFETGQTFYQSFSGDGALMSGKPVKIFGITDGTSNTFMVAEAGMAVEWTKPTDIRYSPKRRLPKLGGIFDGDFNVAMCDGSVRFVKKGVKDANLKKYITIAGADLPEAKDLEPESK